MLPPTSESALPGVSICHRHGGFTRKSYFRSWRVTEVPDYVLRSRLLRYAGQTQHAFGTSRMTQGGPRHRSGEISKLLNVCAWTSKTEAFVHRGPKSHFAFFRASGNVQIVLALEKWIGHSQAQKAHEQ